MKAKIRIFGLILIAISAFLIINGEILGGYTRFIGSGLMILGIMFIAAVSKSTGYD